MLQALGRILGTLFFQFALTQLNLGSTSLRRLGKRVLVVALLLGVAGALVIATLAALLISFFFYLADLHHLIAPTLVVAAITLVGSAGLGFEAWRRLKT